MSTPEGDALTEQVAGQTVPMAFLETCTKHTEQVALRWRNDDGSYDEWTYGDYRDRVAGATTYLEGLGVEPGDRVVLMMRNITDFHFLDLAVKFCGGTPISIYNSSAPDQIDYLVNHSQAKVALVEDESFAERFAPVRDKLTTLEHLVSIADVDDDELYGGEPADLEAATSRCTPDSLATMIYTSGTTGPPKGVMLDHENILWTAAAYMEMIDADLVGFRAISYLPMAHIAERMSTHYLAIYGGLEVTDLPDFAQLGTYLSEVRPNTIFGVPRVWEKLYAGVNAALSADPEKKEKFDEAVAAALPIVEAKAEGTATEEQIATWDFLDEAAFRGVRELLGLDQAEFAVTGAAPIPAEMLAWFRAIGVPLSEIYGMSESSGPMTWEPYAVRPGTVGKAFYGVEVALAEDGEIICRGGNVFRGYLDNPEKTAEALDDDGWLHSGDIGEVDDDGYFKVVDRKKELIITAGGKNISPANLEAALKMIDVVGQACAIGDQRKFVSALLVLDPDAAPSWAAANGKEGTSVADLAHDPDLVAHVEGQLREVMAEFNNAEAVKKVHVLDHDWLPDSDVLTPTSKLKRRGIHARYEAEIEAMYQ